MIAYYMMTAPEDKLLEVEKKFKPSMLAYYGFIADGWEGTEARDAAIKSKDPFIFPDQADDETLKKHPLTVITTAEFCLYNTACQTLGKRLEKFDRLAELILVPSGGHMYQTNYTEKFCLTAMEAVSKSIAVYLRGESAE